MNTVPHPDDGYQTKVLTACMCQEESRAKFEKSDRRTRHLPVFCRDEEDSSGSSHLR
jgi:hypothetical protein